jgi:hypothetical protein
LASFSPSNIVQFAGWEVLTWVEIAAEGFGGDVAAVAAGFAAAADKLLPDAAAAGPDAVAPGAADSTLPLLLEDAVIIRLYGRNHDTVQVYCISKMAV